MEKNRNRYKWICYIILIYGVLVLQTTVLRDLRIFGGTPSLMPFIVCAIAMIEGVNSGAAAGLAAGLLSDALLSPSEGFYTVTYVICAIVISWLSAYIFWKNYFTALFYGIIAAVITDVLYFIIFMLILGRGGFMSLFEVLPGELLTTFIFTPFVYYAIIHIYRRFYVADEINLD